jgi:hypothetical protein
MGSSGRLPILLLAVGVLAALAALFAPAEPWRGIDLGATGGAVFMLVLVASIALFAVRGESVFPEDMSVAERRAWVGLVFISIVLLSFARHLWAMNTHGGAPQRPDDLFARHFIERLVPLMVAWSVISHLIGRRAGGIEIDERDLRLRHRADRVSDWAFTLIVIAGIIVLAFVPAEFLAWWLAPIALANLLIGLLIARSLLEHAVLAFSYRSTHV